jgi:hypothetical protein
MPVGWNCTNSMSCSGRPARSRHAAAVAGAGMRRSGREIGAAITAGRQHNHLGRKRCIVPSSSFQASDAAAGAVFAHDEVEREIFDEELACVRSDWP